MALSLLIDGVEYISELLHETLSINQTNDGLNSTCEFIIRDAGVIRKDVWTVGVTRVEDGDVITGHTTFSNPKVEVSVVDGATVYFAGILSRISVGPIGCINVGPYIEPTTQVLRCYCHDFSALLEESIIDALEEYTNQTDEAIIDDIFGKYVTGIDFATHVVPVYTFKSISFENITVRQALDLIIDRSGAVWYIDYSKKLHYAEEEANAPAWHLSDVPDQVTTFSYLDPVGRETDATNLVNMVFIVASTGGTWFTNETSRADYGDHKFIVRDARLSITESIAARGAAILDKFKDPVEVYTIRTYKDGLRAGMHVRFICAYLDIDDTFLINRLQVTFPVDGEPLYEIELGGLESSVGGAARRLDVDQIYSEPPITSTQLPLASRGWGHDMTFSATDDDTVAWTAGTITTASGQTFNINAGNSDDPGAMVAKTIIYLDTVISLTDLQMTTVETAAIGNNRIMVAVAWPSGVAGVDAGFQVFGATGELATYLNATNVIANCITANEIYGNTLSVIAADMGTLTAGLINITGGAGTGRVILNVAGVAIYDAAANLRIHLDANDGTFELTSAEAGNARIEIDNTEIVGYDAANTKQFYLSAADGVAYAGAGAVWLDEDGLSLTGANQVTSTVKWLIGGNIVADMKSYLAANEYWLYIQTLSPASINDKSKIYLEANAPAGSNDCILSLISGKNAVEGWASFYLEGADRFKIEKDIIRAYDDLYVDDDLRVGLGLYVGSTAVDPDTDDIWVAKDIRIGGGLYVGQTGVDPDVDDIVCDGTIAVGYGDHWKLGDYTAGTRTDTGFIDVNINGVGYRLLCELP